jgi:protein-disulfide isomerase
MKAALLLLISFFSVVDSGSAQTLKDLVSAKTEILGPQSLKSKAYLFIQEDCEACEKSLQALARCSFAIRSKMNLVVLESEAWAVKKIKSPEVQKVKFASLNFMTREEAQKIKVRGTPTYYIGQIFELKPLSCQDIKKSLSDLK